MQIGRESILIIMGEVFRCWGVRHLPFLVIQPLRILLFITGLLLFHKTCLLSSNERFPPPSTFIHPFFSLPPQHTAKCYFPHPAMFGVFHPFPPRLQQKQECSLLGMHRTDTRWTIFCAGPVIYYLDCFSIKDNSHTAYTLELKFNSAKRKKGTNEDKIYNLLFDFTCISAFRQQMQLSWFKLTGFAHKV